MWRLCVESLFCGVVLGVLYSLAVILPRKRWLGCLINCVVAVCVVAIFVTVSLVGVQFVIVTFPGHTHLLSHDPFIQV